MEKFSPNFITTIQNNDLLESQHNMCIVKYFLDKSFFILNETFNYPKKCDTIIKNVYTSMEKALRTYTLLIAYKMKNIFRPINVTLAPKRHSSPDPPRERQNPSR